MPGPSSYLDHLGTITNCATNPTSHSLMSFIPMVLRVFFKEGAQLLKH